MDDFTPEELEEIRATSHLYASEEIDNRGLTDPDVVSLLAHHLFIFRHEWAYFDEADAEVMDYDAVIDRFFNCD